MASGELVVDMADKSILTAENLKTKLWETLKELRTGEMEAEEGKAIALQAKTILDVVKAELKIMETCTALGQRPESVYGFLEPETKTIEEPQKVLEDCIDG